MDFEANHVRLSHDVTIAPHDCPITSLFVDGSAFLFQRLVDDTGGYKFITDGRMKLPCVTPPKVLCLDEPTNFLDFETAPWRKWLMQW